MQNRNLPIFTILAVACLCFTACSHTANHNPPPTAQHPVVQQPSSCNLPVSKRLSSAIQEARATLSNPACVTRFDDIFSRLIDIARNDPASVNRREFSDFLNWTRDQGIISTRQAMQLYTSYFSYKFATLPRDYQTCSYCRNLDTLKSDMQTELRNKEVGLLQICGERDLYARAASDYRDMLIILDATCKACLAGD